MSFIWNAIFSLSIAAGAAVGIIRYKKLDGTFFPFLCLLWLGLINEIVSIGLMIAGFSNAIEYNLFALAETFIIVWQFKKWELFGRAGKLYLPLQVFVLLGWLVTMFVFDIRFFNSFFLIGHSVLIVFLGITQMNRTSFEEPGNIFRHPVFLICLGFIIYFTFSILVETFWLYGLTKSKKFRVSIFEILAYINLFTNIIYALAALWIPLKRKYLLQS
jgi:hypothetical protein